MVLASFPGPAKLSVACSTRFTVLKATESWAGPGNEASVVCQLLEMSVQKKNKTSSLHVLHVVGWHQLQHYD